MIAYLTPTPPTLSETFIVDEIRTLRGMGVEISQRALSDPASTRNLASRLAFAARVLLAHPVGAARWMRAALRFRETPRWVMLRSLELGMQWRRERPQGVHVHFVDQTIVAAVLATRFWRVPLSATAHARDIFDPPASRFAKLNRYGVRMVAVCRYNREELVARGTPRRSIVVVPCGVDTSSSPPSRSTASYDVPLRVLVIGRLVSKKGIDDLLEAVTAPSVAKMIEEIRIIGEGPELARLEELAESARKGGVAVSLLGPLERLLHVRHYVWANVFCLPCKVAPDGDRDSMPVAIKEALVQRLPVITTTAVGIPEMLDSSTAVLVEPGDVGALRSALRDFAAMSAQKRADLAQAGYQRMHEYFDLRLTVGAVRDLLLKDHAPTCWDSSGVNAEQRYTVVVFSPEPWSAHAPTNKHQLARRFAGDAPTLYVSIGGRSVRCGIRPLLSVTRDASGVLVCDFPGLPERLRQRLPLARRAQDQLAVAAACRVLNHYGGPRPRVFVYFPMSIRALRRMRPAGLLYHCVDHHASFPAWSLDTEALLDDEMRLVRAADAVVASAPALVEHCAQWRRDVMLMRNVGDVPLFSRAATTPLANKCRPLGFFHGTFSNHKIDFAFIEALMRATPDFDWQLLGAPSDEASAQALERLSSQKNVSCLEARPQEEVVDALADADLLVMPYACNEHTRHVFPLKLLEYLATGKPLICTPLESVIEYCDGAVDYAASGEEAAVIARRLLDEPAGRREGRLALAKGRTWEARAEEMMALLAER
jgi:colanic acid/amylovoran biosynthesis glycosyltransferase